MKIETGKPLMDGLYVVFVPAVVRDWLEPHIVMWNGGEWFHRWSSEKYQDDVRCWSGPLPVMRQDLYVEFAKIISNSPLVERKIGKSAALGAGYGKREFDL